MTTPGKATLWIILASASVGVMGGAIIAPVLNLMGEGLGVDPGAARVIITTHSIFIALCSPLIGVLIDRIGVKRPFIMGLVLYGLGGASGFFINDYWLMLASRALLGIGIAAILTSITVLILGLYEGPRRNKVMGWRVTGNSTGGVIWPLLGGFLGTLSWRLPFAAYLVGIPLGLFALLTVPETHRGAARPTDAAGKEKSVLSLFRETPTLFVAYGLTFLAMVLLYAIVVFIPKVAEQLGITSPFHIGIFIALPGLTGGVASLMYGRIRAILSYKAIFVITLALWAAAFIPLSQAPSIWLVSLTMALFGIGQGMVRPAVIVWAGEVVPASFRGRITSYLTTFGFVGQFLSPIILSPVESSLGLNAVFLVVGGTCALLLVLFLVLFRQ